MACENAGNKERERALASINNELEERGLAPRHKPPIVLPWPASLSLTGLIDQVLQRESELDLAEQGTYTTPTRNKKS